MTYTPVEVRHVHVGRSLLGYKRGAIEKILEEVAESFETVWRDRGDLAEKVELLEGQLTELKAREQLLVETLASAEQVATDVKAQAKREAELILAEAHHEARAVWVSAQGERERLVAETKRIEVFLRAALEAVAQGAAVTEPEAPQQELLPLWPRQETRENPAVAAAGADPAPALEPESTLEAELGPVRETLRRFLPKVVGGGEAQAFHWDE